MSERLSIRRPPASLPTGELLRGYLEAPGIELAVVTAGAIRDRQGPLAAAALAPQAVELRPVRSLPGTNDVVPRTTAAVMQQNRSLGDRAGSRH